MGLQLRVDALVRNAKTDERRTAIRDAAKRLVDPVGMGKEYQVMGITNLGRDASGDETESTAGVWPFVKEGTVSRAP